MQESLKQTARSCRSVVRHVKGEGLIDIILKGFIVLLLHCITVQASPFRRARATSTLTVHTEAAMALHTEEKRSARSVAYNLQP